MRIHSKQAFDVYIGTRERWFQAVQHLVLYGLAVHHLGSLGTIVCCRKIPGAVGSTKCLYSAQCLSEIEELGLQIMSDAQIPTIEAAISRLNELREGEVAVLLAALALISYAPGNEAGDGFRRLDLQSLPALTQRQTNMLAAVQDQLKPGKVWLASQAEHIHT